MECNLCSRYFRSAINYQVHMKQHKAVESHNWKCHTCNLEFISELSLDEHRLSTVHKFRIKQKRTWRSLKTTTMENNGMCVYFVV